MTDVRGPGPGWKQRFAGLAPREAAALITTMRWTDGEIRGEDRAGSRAKGGRYENTQQLTLILTLLAKKGLDLSIVTEADMLDLRKDLQAAVHRGDYDQNTMYGVVKTWNCAMRYLHGLPKWEKGKTNDMTPMRMKGFKTNHKKTRVWTDADLCAAREAIRTGWYPSELQRLAFRALWEVDRVSGLRSSSLLDDEIVFDQIDVKKGILTVKRLKNEEGELPVILDTFALQACIDLELYMKGQDYWRGRAKTLVFLNPKTGRPWTYTFHLRNLKKAAGNAGVSTHVSTRTARKIVATTYVRELGVQATAKILGILPETVANYDMNDQETMAQKIRDAAPGQSAGATAKDIAFQAIIGARAGRVDPVDAEAAIRLAEQENAAPGQPRPKRFDPVEYA